MMVVVMRGESNIFWMVSWLVTQAQPQRRAGSGWDLSLERAEPRPVSERLLSFLVASVAVDHVVFLGLLLSWPLRLSFLGQLIFSA